MSGISPIGGVGGSNSEYQQAVEAVVFNLGAGVVQRAGKNPLGQLFKTMDQERKTAENEQIDENNDQDTTYIPNLA
jgi:hypothetical protein